MEGGSALANTQPVNLRRIDQELAIAEFELSVLGHLLCPAPATQFLRIDARHAKLDGPALRYERPSSVSSKTNTEGADHRWTVFLLGLGSAVCGGTVIGWGVTLSELNLVYWGIPIFLVGVGFISAVLFFSPVKTPAESMSGPHESPQGRPATLLAGHSGWK
ncbi:MAG: hypothetical protein H5U08_00565 [Thermogutta sp.]|uniref:hypothetical protein n=1 Tax=Thermogutta sp. TaxID=1962930 RepID=UPI0019914124|nr:hypothetical protein [Thermogutta sp.]MBC7350827.1 hypothetical protein [Thermogutta sp.]